MEKIKLKITDVTNFVTKIEIDENKLDQFKEQWRTGMSIVVNEPKLQGINLGQCVQFEVEEDADES